MTETVSLRCLTFNTACYPPPSGNDEVAALLGFQGGNNASTPDIFAISFQEVHSRLDKYFFEAFVSGEDAWTAAVTDELVSRGYKRIRSIRVLGIVLSVFLLQKHLTDVRQLETQYIRLSLGGYLGFKGAVAIRFLLYGNSYCFVNSHLSAHDHNFDLRVSEYGTIVDGVRFDKGANPEILDHDYVVWMGDLNFRLLERDSLSREHIVASIASGELRPLLEEGDQLGLARREERAFHQLEEGRIDFAPTYKFVIGSEKGEYDKKRRPAWTDRVLHRAKEGTGGELKLDKYFSHQAVTTSDHKPVTCLLSSSRVSSEDLWRERWTRDIYPSSPDSSPPPLPPFGAVVQFLPPAEDEEWALGREAVAKYTVREGGRPYLRAWDWVGLYKAGFRSLEDYVTFTWAARGESGDDGTRRAAFMSVGVAEAGEYVLVYVGEDYCVLGIGQPFRIAYE